MFCLFTPGTDDAQLVGSPDGDDNGSDYEADDEVSLLPSPADTNANGGELDDSEHGDVELITPGNSECFLFEIQFCSATSTPILLLCYHSGSQNHFNIVVVHFD